MAGLAVAAILPVPLLSAYVFSCSPLMLSYCSDTHCYPSPALQRCPDMSFSMSTVAQNQYDAMIYRQKYVQLTVVAALCRLHHMQQIAFAPARVAAASHLPFQACQLR